MTLCFYWCHKLCYVNIQKYVESFKTRQIAGEDLSLTDYYGIKHILVSLAEQATKAFSVLA